MSLMNIDISVKERIDDFLTEQIDERIHEAEEVRTELHKLLEDIKCLEELQQILRGGEPLESVG